MTRSPQRPSRIVWLRNSSSTHPLSIALLAGAAEQANAILDKLTGQVYRGRVQETPQSYWLFHDEGVFEFERRTSLLLCVQSANQEKLER